MFWTLANKKLFHAFFHLALDWQHILMIKISQCTLTTHYRTASCNIHQTKCSHQDLQANGHRLIVPDHVLNKSGGYGDYSPLKSSLMIKPDYTQNHSAPRIWSIFHCHWPWMLHTIVNNNACQSSLESFPNSFSIQVDQKVAKYSLKFWDWPKGHSTLWKRPSNNTTCYCDILFTSISCYHRIQYSNSHPQATNIPARMTPIATNQARTPITSRAMCHDWRGTRETPKQEE